MKMDVYYNTVYCILIAFIFLPQNKCESESCFCLKKKVEGLSNPVFFEQNPKNDKFYVAQQSGVVRIYSSDWKREAKPLVNLSKDVFTSGHIFDERGLLSIALHPSFSTNNILLTYSTRLILKKEYAVVSKIEIRPDLIKEDILLAIEQPSDKRNGGQVLFGKDGYLYISVGDGGVLGKSNISLAQDSESLLGKILRINVDEKQIVNDHLQFYSIPRDNPFLGNSSWRPEIFASGARNMWRCGVDKASERGDLYCGDTGDSDREEINLIKPGKNYGWNLYEGSVAENVQSTSIVNEKPLYEYPHGDMGQAVVGGYVYRGESFTDIKGYYIFGDYLSGKLFTLNVTKPGSKANAFIKCEENRCPCDARDMAGDNLVSFSIDNQGELYILTKQKGNIFKLIQPLSSVTTCGSIQLSSNNLVTLVIIFTSIFWRHV